MSRRARSSITGRFVSLAYAARHAATTVIETVRNTIRKAKP